jgi:hypothetical protein
MRKIHPNTPPNSSFANDEEQRNDAHTIKLIAVHFLVAFVSRHHIFQIRPYLHSHLHHVPTKECYGYGVVFVFADAASQHTLQ